MVMIVFGVGVIYIDVNKTINYVFYLNLYSFSIRKRLGLQENR